MVIQSVAMFTAIAECRQLVSLSGPEGSMMYLALNGGHGMMYLPPRRN